MQLQMLNQTIQQKLGNQIFIEEEGQNRYPVFTPFIMDDGDHYTMIIRQIGQSWLITDEGDTLMHLSYRMDYNSLKKGTRQEIIERILSQYGVENRDGELRLPITHDQMSAGIFTFLQALTRITDITFLAREQVRATFMEDFRDFLRSNVPPERLQFDYYHPQFDKKRIYAVDAVINHRETPLYIFGINHDDRCRDVTIHLHTYKSWQIRFQSVAIFEDQQTISRSVLARFSDIADKQFSSLVSSEPQIKNYLMEQLR